MRWLSIALVLLVAAFWVRGHQYDVDNWSDDVDTCQTSNAGRADAAARDRDLALFAQQAAKARRAEGQSAVARGYEDIAGRSMAREGRTLARRQSCAAKFPKPSLLPF